MSFAESITTCLRKYIDFSGRASRSEYWWFTLLIPFVLIASYIYFRGTGGDTRIALPVTLFLVFMILPSMSVQVRRLHDMHRSAWWISLYLLNPVGGLVLLIWSIFPGDPEPNRYGADPRY
ncbi:MAG: DUF805 domain-containing protein [Chloroflexi bacterium]|nr:DUF805 domain-containing protein [Chloroflexota bacterium]